MKFDPSKYTVAKAKPLPVVLLLDTSGSMSAGEPSAKIVELEGAVREMVKDFAHEEQLETEIQVAVITFGSKGVSLDLPYTNASKIQGPKLEAGGNTPMGVALKMAKDMIEDKETTPSRAYRPLVILCSDGQPTDSWEEPMAKFISEGRSSKCDRMAMAIGRDANEEILKKFIEGTENPLFYVKDATSMHKFFKFVTMSVTSRSRSQTPNQIAKLEPPKELLESPKTVENTGNYW